MISSQFLQLRQFCKSVSDAPLEVVPTQRDSSDVRAVASAMNTILKDKRKVTTRARVCLALLAVFAFAELRVVEEYLPAAALIRIEPRRFPSAVLLDLSSTANERTSSKTASSRMSVNLYLAARKDALLADLCSCWY